MTGREARRLLRRSGFRLTSTKRHDMWRDGSGRWVSLPQDQNKTLYGSLGAKVVKLCRGGVTSHMKRVS